jgi:putative FmdB family regulatory protein
MPFYEYQCKSCGHALEAMQKVNDSPLRKCPECGKSTLQRLMSAPVFRLKGGGWYETDFKTDKDGKRNLADQPDADAPKDDKKDSKDAGKEAASKDAPGESAKPADKAEKGEKFEKSEKAEKTEKASEKPASTPAAAGSSKKPASSRKPPKRLPSNRKRRR